MNFAKSRALVLPVIFLMLLCASGLASRAVNAQAPPPPLVNIVFHGDSTIRGEGLPDQPAQNVAALLQSALGGNGGGTYVVINRAVSGASFSTGGTGNINLITSAATQVDPFYNPAAAHNILFVGSLWNDINVGDFEPQIKNNIRKYVQQQAQRGWKVVVMSPTLADYPRQKGSFHVTRLNIIDWLANSYRSIGAVAVTDFSGDALIGTGADTSDKSLWLDQLHPASGYNRIVAAYAAQTVRVIDGTADKPSVPSGFSLAGRSTGEIKIACQPPPDSFPVDHYELRVTGGAFNNRIFNIGRNFPYTLGGLQSAARYSAEIRAVDPSGRASEWTAPQSEYTFAAAMSGWTPVDLPGVRFWGKDAFQDLARTVPASANGDPVSVLEDETSGAAHFTRAPESQSPALLGLSAIGQARGFRFSGPGTKLTSPKLGAFLRNDFTIAMLLKMPEASQSSGMLLEWGDTAPGRRRSIAVNPIDPVIGFSAYDENVMTDKNVAADGDGGAPHWIVVTRKGSLITIYVDGEKQVSGRPNLMKYASAGVAIGGNLNDWQEQFQGFTGETVISSTALEGTDLHALNEYFRRRVQGK